MDKGNPKDIFLCHATPDKKDFVDPLAKALEERGLSVFKDDDDIFWGDGILKEISRALPHCRFVLVFLSDNFFGRRWAEKELYSAMSLSIEGKLTVLPLFIADKERIWKKYSFLKDILGFAWEVGIDKIVDKLTQLVKKETPVLDKSQRLGLTSLDDGGVPSLNFVNYFTSAAGSISPDLLREEVITSSSILNTVKVLQPTMALSLANSFATLIFERYGLCVSKRFETKSFSLFYELLGFYVFGGQFFLVPDPVLNFVKKFERDLQAYDGMQISQLLIKLESLNKGFASVY